MILKAAKQSGWLTEEEFDDEVRRAVQEWTDTTREPSYLYHTNGRQQEPIFTCRRFSTLCPTDLEAENIPLLLQEPTESTEPPSNSHEIDKEAEDSIVIKQVIVRNDRQPNESLQDQISASFELIRPTQQFFHDSAHSIASPTPDGLVVDAAAITQATHNCLHDHPTPSTATQRVEKGEILHASTPLSAVNQ